MVKKPLDISTKLTGNNGYKYFLKNFNYKLTGKNGYFDKKTTQDYSYFKHIIPDELVNYPITPKCNILIPLVVDTEFTAYNGNILKLTKEKLQNLGNRQLIQIDRLDQLIIGKAPELKGIFELTGNKEIKQINSDVLDKVNFKAKPTLHLTSQIKHSLYNDAEILLNPDLKSFYEQHITNPDYKYPCYNQLSQGHIFDFLKLKGFEIEVGKRNELDKEEFKKYPTCTFKIYAYFLLADLHKIFQTLTEDEYIKRISITKEQAELWVKNQLFTDLKKAFETKNITQERRLKINDNKGFSQQWHTQRLITINGLKYRLVFDLVDLGAMQGAISFNNVLENLGMNTSDKNLLDDLKDNMLLAMIERPADFKKYALGDLIVYEAFKNHNNLFKQVYKDIGLENYFTEVKLTTGASVNDFQQSYLLKKLNLERPTTENINLLKYYTLPASAKNLSQAVNAKNRINNGEILRKEFLSKTNGGRCYNNRMTINTKSSNFTLADIDITGAYSSIASVLDFYYGCPVVISFKEYKVNLREFLKYYEKKYLIKRGFKLSVETKKDKLFEIEQDLIQSWVKVKYELVEITKNQNVITGVDLENTPTAILTRELKKASLTWDELNIIRTEWTKKQRDEFLDNTYMISALFYPKDFQCQSVEEFKSKKEIHKRFNDAIPYSYINNEDGEYNNYWFSTNFGELGLDKIIQKRVENKKINPSLAYLYKLIGNTLYGVNVSRHFDTSNILLAANITAMCRCGMWLTEKALNIYQTITDGGIFELNKVIHLMRGKIDTSLFVRAYQKNNRDLVQNYKWKTKPITENGEKIDFHQGKGWLIDDLYYGNIDRNLYVKLTEENKELIKKYGENHELVKQKENELKPFENELKKLFTKINELVFNHIRKIFPNNDLFNSKFEKVKTNENGIGIKDQNGKYIYEAKTGVFSFEVKNLCNYVSFHGSADYMYNNIKNELTTKMRGYDVKPNVVAWKIENGNLIPDTNYYNEIQPIQRFLEDLLNNPERVKIQLPFTKTSILKPAQFSKEFNKTFKYCDLKCGDDFMEIVRLPIFTPRFKFQTLEQLKGWTRYYNSLKRRYEGLSFEILYFNKEDNSINYQKMMSEIDKYISQKEIIENPKKIYDKNGNLKRDIIKKEKFIYIQNYIYLINWLKNLVRFTIVGGKQFLSEKYKIETDGLVYKLKRQSHYILENYNSYNDINTYSENKAFRNYRENN